jgi:hypothetical protein
VSYAVWPAGTVAVDVATSPPFAVDVVSVIMTTEAIKRIKTIVAILFVLFVDIFKFQFSIFILSKKKSSETFRPPQ